MCWKKIESNKFSTKIGSEKLKPKYYLFFLKMKTESVIPQVLNTNSDFIEFGSQLRLLSY